ncbi:MAG TPA: tetratricopeptide repeat protein, partial [Terriglobales bacterium]|nr:tetratricopeptide repeat protein [Terriglobales bacterium]
LSDRYALQVVPANDVRSEGVNSAKSARQQLGVDMVVEGSLQPVANMLRATFSVVDTQTGRQVRAGTITVPSGDPFGLQDQLANSIVRALGIDVSKTERSQLAARGTTVSAAYDDYLQGLGYLEDYQKKENLELAIAAFNRALQHDSNFAMAYAGLGEAHWHKYMELNDSSELSDASLACQRALAIEADLAEAHRCMGEVYGGNGKYKEAAQQLEIAVSRRPTDDESIRALGMAYEQLGQFAQAEATYRRAIDFRPHYWAGYNWLGGFYSSRGQYGKAIEMFERVKAIAPDNYRGYNNAGGIYILQGEFGTAIKQFERSVQLRPSYAGYSNLGTAYFFQRRFADAAAAYSRAVQLKERGYVSWGNLGDAQYFSEGQRPASSGSYNKAIQLAEEAVKVNPKDAFALGSLAMYHAMLNQRSQADDYMRRALALQPAGPDVWWQASVVYSQLQRTDQTLAALQSALAAGLSSAYITSGPYFDNLSNDPRFQQLIKSAQKLEQH